MSETVFRKSAHYVLVREKCGGRLQFVQYDAVTGAYRLSTNPQNATLWTRYASAQELSDTIKQGLFDTHEVQVVPTAAEYRHLVIG